MMTSCPSNQLKGKMLSQLWGKKIVREERETTMIDRETERHNHTHRHKHSQLDEKKETKK